MPRTAKPKPEKVKCKAMLGGNEPKPCRFSAADETGYCNVHWKSIYQQEQAAARKAAIKAEMDARADAFIEFAKTHPSVWERMPRA